MKTTDQTNVEGHSSKLNWKNGLAVVASASVIFGAIYLIKSRMDSIDNASRISATATACSGIDNCFLIPRPKSFNNSDETFCAVKDEARFFPYMEIYSKPSATTDTVKVSSNFRPLNEYQVVKVKGCTERYCEVSVDIPDPNLPTSMPLYGIIEPRDLFLPPNMRISKLPTPKP